MSPNHAPISISSESIAIQAKGLGWHGQTLGWPEGLGHFFLAGEVTLDGSPEEINVQLLFADEDDTPCFFFNLVPGAVRTRPGYFCLPRESARAVPELAGGKSKPDWERVSKVVVRCASDLGASAIITNFRVFAEATVGPLH
jgi:hypothetical protein